ncbi:MAG: hypothetical protein ACI4WG_07565 [Erysipelotrichaceae bacterium]
MNYLNTTEVFLKKYNQHFSDISIDDTVSLMLKDMQNGLKGQPSSLLMIPTYLSTSGQLPLNLPVVVIDAGGTNLRIAAVQFTENGLDVLKFEKYPMLGANSEMTGEQFIDKLVDLLIPFLQYSHNIGFCFSFPAEILPNKDGKIISFSKENQITDYQGLILGQSMNRKLQEKGYQPDLKVVVLNDTVATLLGGPNLSKGASIDGQIGLILGTGTNSAYIEKTALITKIAGCPMEEMIINTESGMFDKVNQGYFDKIVDDNSFNPGDSKFEKMISGIYLGSVINQTIKQAAKEGLFSNPEQIITLSDFTMVEVDSFLRKPFSDNLLANATASLHDKELLYFFIDQALERSSKLVVANLASDIIQMDRGKSICSPVRIMIEGSTYHKCYSFKEKINKYMIDYVNGQLKRYYCVVNDNDANLAGSAVAALKNL